MPKSTASSPKSNKKIKEKSKPTKKKTKAKKIAKKRIQNNDTPSILTSEFKKLLNKKYPQNPQGVFQFYHDWVKPLFAEVEAQDNRLPVELLFEIHAAFDHLKRHFVGPDTTSHAAGKALAHLKRAVLDAFKLKLVDFNHQIQDINLKDFSFVDNGNYITNFISDRKSLVTISKEARLLESHPEISKAFAKWVEVHIGIDNFSEKYFDPLCVKLSPNKKNYAQSSTQKYITKKTLFAFVLGIATSLLGSYLFYLATAPPLPIP